METKTNITQKLLLYVLYSLIILMIIFSLMAIGDKGKQGYDKCIQDKCDKFDEATCKKARTIMNCCQGAGGQVVQTENNLGCLFNWNENKIWTFTANERKKWN